MTATTATWAIPYATSTDRPCDGATITESMAERVDTIMHQFDLDLASLVTIPYASIVRDVTWAQTTTTGGFNVGGGSTGGSVAFTAVNADTANLANLAANPTVLTIPATLPGVYLTGVYAEIAVTPIGTQNPGDGGFVGIDVREDVAGTLLSRETIDLSNVNISELQKGAAANPIVVTSAAPTSIHETVSGIADIGNTVTLNTANMFAFWLSD